MNKPQTILDAYAAVLLYPDPDHLDRIQACIDQFSDEQSDVRQMIRQHASTVASWSLSEMEELYIKTFDLNKTGTLDLGWHLFGEDYNRGLFLVKLRQYLQFFEIPETNELPDHVSLVLKILGRMPYQEACLFTHACVLPSLETIAGGIGDENPYDRLIQGLILYLTNVFEVPAGFEESTESEYERFANQLPIIQ